MGSIPGLERSPAGGHGNSLRHSYRENATDKGALQATVHRNAKSQIKHLTRRKKKKPKNSWQLQNSYILLHGLRILYNWDLY